MAVSPSPHVLSRGNVALSTQTTRRPRSWAVIAAAVPAGPAPTTTTSRRSVIATDGTGSNGPQRTSAREKIDPDPAMMITIHTATSATPPAVVWIARSCAPASFV